MRYAVLSDIHSNLEALRASIEAISKDSVEAYIVAGDIVGYGADPDECIALTKSLNPSVLTAGNHDWGVLGLLDLEYFNESAREAIVWTKKIIKKEGLDFLRSLELVREGNGFSVVHGSLLDPEKFSYVISPGDAADMMNLMKQPVSFIGHSHTVEIYYGNEKTLKHASEGVVKIDRKLKYVINAGSVGQPRDGDPRASYVIYDDERHTAEIKRVEYDIPRAQKKIIDSGLPERLALRLSKGY